MLALGPWDPWGVMCTKAGIKNIKDTEEELLCFPFIGQSLLRRCRSPSLTRCHSGGMPLHLDFAERVDVAVHELLLKPRGV